ncbi:twin-arginine translocation signal domain-containing protein [Vibrio metschnikovii]|uniref:Twin-arginine translocation signal domain-containing protein n=2 Tax=Unclassified Bacteria TaxID=49928 RepID=A0AAU6UVP0_UNCXX|nr:twin-arginine translocation signal domain-containing protein [Vibrio sp. A11]EKO3591205.1 twin-arginine translocation signal domain-containing protein [Vibrio metschnikovii]EKO3632341.1 twin-arginine translocation signal domain-containing protein [Vibrio metschnikovii]EKO3640597.1 twin-arginine translocation signal domain-containing protein [Vibrio metschnikovii]EKO3661442.1 twin-arginine translocation signal domain-containing protein [Vibrio metschnikovii]EKO3665159.1 twin-arginine translo
MAISRRTFLKAGVGVGAVGVGYRQINKTKTQANIVIVGGGERPVLVLPINWDIIWTAQRSP